VKLVLIGLVLAASGWVAWLYGADVDRARRQAKAGAMTVLTPCGPIEYAVAGKGRPLLVVHGAGGGYDQGMDFGSPLASRGIQVVAMSRFGYLGTPLPADASAEAQADAHACLLDALGIREAAILGASAGAPSALQFALRHPTRTTALVIVVPASWAPRGAGEPVVKSPPATAFLFDTALRWDFAFWAARHVAPRALTRSLLATPPELVDAAPVAERERVARTLDRILPVSARREGLLNDARVVDRQERYPLERITAPTLVMGIEDDLFGTWDAARFIASRVPHARWVGYPSGGHLWVGHHDELVSNVASFLGSGP
jgi:2-hydroxy-6-oxonona-2,4-dienedioate hydrolase